MGLPQDYISSIEQNQNENGESSGIQEEGSAEDLLRFMVNYSDYVWLQRIDQ
jgi:hypothetical protein